MNQESFDEKMASVLSRLDSFKDRRGETDQRTPPVDELLTELSAALEELHIADEELRERNQELAIAALRYQELFELAPDAYLKTDLNGIIREANRAATALFGVSITGLLGKPLPSLVARDWRTQIRQVLRHVAVGQSVRDHDVLIQPRHARPAPCACNVMPLRDRGDQVIGQLWLIRNISERKASEEALRAAEERFRVALNQSPVMVFRQDRELRYTWVYHSIGMTREDMIGKHDAELTTPATAARLLEIKTDALENGNVRREQVEWSHGTSTAWYDLTVEAYRNSSGQIDGIIGAATDITELKQQQQALQSHNARLDRAVSERTAELEQANLRLRSLTQAVVTVQEEERRRVSRELHDEAGQALTALKMNLEVLREDVPSELPHIKERLGELVSLITGTIEEIRALAQALRPPALDTADINIVLEGVCRQFARGGRLAIYYVGSPLPSLPEPESITLYRFLQEALTNIVKHAEATEVHVTLDSDAEEILLSVQDNGRGFDSEGKPLTLKPDKIGLMGMQERLKAVGGWFEIDSEPGKGVRLAGHIPHKEAE